jgi:integrase
MIEGVHFVRAARPGKPVRWYVYAFRGGPCILKAEGPAKPKLDKAALDALAAATADHGPDAATLARLIFDYRTRGGGSPEWQALAKGTRDLWGPQLDRIEARWGKTPLRFWSDPRMKPKIVAWRDSRAATPRSADIGVQALGVLLGFGLLRGAVTINIADGIPTLYRPDGREEIIWTSDDIDRFSLAALSLNRPHVIDALWLACLTGFRRADLAALTWDQVGDHAIARTAQKKSKGRRRRAVVPLIPASRDLLDELRTRPRAAGVEHVLVNSLGRPWQPASLTQAMNEARDLANIAEPAAPELGLPARAKHLHDCRGTFVTHLCRQRLTDREIANITAWSEQNVSAIRRRYVDDAAVIVALGRRIAEGSL